MLDQIKKLSRLITNGAPSFRFIVTVNGVPYGVFTECALPVIEWAVDPVKEGGLNTYVHQLPRERKEAKMTFMNGVGTGAMVAWYLMAMNGVFDTPGMGLRRMVTVSLLNSLKIPVMTWNIADAFPVKWSGPQLKTGENSVAIQTLELACGEITIVPGIGF